MSLSLQSDLGLQQGVLVVMGKSEMLQGYMVGCTRHIDDLYDGSRPAHAIPDSEAAQRNIEGALAEKVVAKHFGVYWSGALGNKRAKDVGGAQVRSTPLPSGHLIVHRSDPPDDPFVLVCGCGPRFWIRGWILGRDAQAERYWKTEMGKHQLRSPAFFVPQHELAPIDSLQLPWSCA